MRVGVELTELTLFDRYQHDGDAYQYLVSTSAEERDIEDDAMVDDESDELKEKVSECCIFDNVI